MTHSDFKQNMAPSFSRAMNITEQEIDTGLDRFEPALDAYSSTK